ncbi:hypothetical protein V493_03618 [Pseudogymnoascus sp. VKM F-4281 (FW-2241)]|nr:hypothetical protein V493_03618 [Pseudogymnoascus sp. VKM F-4281 (FW-2241)]
MSATHHPGSSPQEHNSSPSVAPESPQTQGESSQAPGDSPQADDFEEDDSAYGDDGENSTTTTVAATILEYRELHGRTFQNFPTTEYWGPNDDKQNEQLDIGHHMLTLLLDGKLFLAPISLNPQKVIDVGTGTGIWAIDFADAHPSAMVIGTDLSPIQPCFVPPNLKFELDDAQLDWTYEENSFDFVHIRCLMGSINDWAKLYSDVFRCTRPGGYIESLEMDIQFTSDDGSVKPGDVMYDWSTLFINAGETMQRTFKIPKMSRRLIEAAGFVDVVETKYKVPVGGWMEDKKWKEVGRWNLLYLKEGLEGMALFILKNILRWEYTEVQALLGRMRSALNNKKNHAYYEIHVVYGRKP